MTDKESESVNGFGKIGGESSQNAYHIIVHSSENYGPHLINPLDKFNFRDRNFVKNRI